VRGGGQAAGGARRRPLYALSLTVVHPERRPMTPGSPGARRGSGGAWRAAAPPLCLVTDRGPPRAAPHDPRLARCAAGVRRRVARGGAPYTPISLKKTPHTLCLVTDRGPPRAAPHDARLGPQLQQLVGQRPPARSGATLKLKGNFESGSSCFSF